MVQRYDAFCSNKDDRGLFVLHEDFAALKAENKSLNARYKWVDCLAALFPPELSLKDVVGHVKDLQAQLKAAGDTVAEVTAENKRLKAVYNTSICNDPNGEGKECAYRH